MVSYRKIINPQVRFRKHSILLFFQCVVPFFRSYEIQPVPSRLTSGNFIQTSYNVKVANIFLITNTLKNIYNEVYPKIPRNSIGLISGLNERLCFIASWQLDLCQPLKDGFFVSNAIDIAKTMSIA